MGNLPTRPFRIRKSRVAIPVVAMVLACAGGGVAQAADGGLVVPSRGAVAGHGYAYWLAAVERIFFAYGGSPPLCQTLHANGRAVEFLDGANTDQQIKCSASPGEPIYVHGIDNECSTIKGDHDGFGTSPAQLERCARKGFKGDSGTVSIDGVKLASYSRLITATNAVEIHVPKHNSLNIPAQSGTSAAYGEGLLLRGLAAGSHRIRVRSVTPGGSETRVFVVHVS
jgi:hypothetical protein